MVYQKMRNVALASALAFSFSGCKALDPSQALYEQRQGTTRVVFMPGDDHREEDGRYRNTVMQAYLEPTSSGEARFYSFALDASGNISRIMYHQDGLRDYAVPLDSEEGRRARQIGQRLLSNARGEEQGRLEGLVRDPLPRQSGGRTIDEIRGLD